MIPLFPSEFEHTISSLEEIRRALLPFGADRAILKLLPKNANDKNQVYFASDYSSLHSTFDLVLADRGSSTSRAKDRTSSGRTISEAVFQDFVWALRDGSTVRARNVKAIVYPQYPEARLSGFQTVDSRMPRSLSVEFTKTHRDVKRLLVLGCKPGGACVAFVFMAPPPRLLEEISALPGLENSRVCKLLILEQNASEKVFRALAKAVGRPMPGCRLDAFGRTLPFTGTQVCGYTLEHALGIVPNAGKDGDLHGIELKTHTQVKVTLFTPEPDGGLYARSFEEFMRTFGYQNPSGDYRLTGLHRVGDRNAKSGLALRVREYRMQADGSDWIRDSRGERQPFDYNPKTPLTAKMDAVEVTLEDEQQFVAASWSLERLMNNWGAKHNEVVFLSASKVANPNTEQVKQGYEYEIRFSPRVIWCRGTSVERMLNAINEGVIFLDPGPKLVPGEPAKNKRRAQWRVNDITKAVNALYERVETRDIQLI